MFLPQLWIYTIFLIFLRLHHLSFTTAISSPVSNNITCFKNNKKAASFGETRAFGFDIVNLMIVVIVTLNIIVHKLRQVQEAKYAEKDKLVLLSSGQTCRHFSLAEILWATNNFDDSCLIGKGGSAKVYKGMIDNGTTSVAIKRLILTSKQVEGSLFWTEIEMLSKFRHSNLLSLIGYCDEWHEMILVFEYIPRGTLSEHLHQSFEKGHYTLSWIQRLRICIGAARGLDYLHTGASIHQRVIHRDMKSTNILLDDNLEAKIADFGISKIVAINQGCTYVSTIVRGTFGYMDPSYFSTGRLTRKSDVYAFGVVLFEVLCGRRAVDLSRHDEQSGLAGWALHCINEGGVNEIIDSNLKMKISRNSLLAFVKIACQCLDRQPRCRPTMAEVVVVLEFALALQESPDSARIEGGITSDNSHSSTTMEVLYGSDQIKPFHRTRITFSRKIRQILSAPIQVLSVQSNAKHSSYSRNKNSRVGNRWKLNKVGIVPAENDGMRMKKIGIVPEAKGIIATAKIKMFSLAELKSTTRDFSPDMMLAEGYYGRVYIGWLDEDMLSPSRIGIGMAVAIKRFNDVSEGFRAVQTEVDLCGKLYHPNFLKLLGFCSEGQEFLLIYEYMPKGTSERYMYRDNGKSLS